MNYGGITAILTVIGIILFAIFITFYRPENTTKKGFIVMIVIIAVMLGIVVFQS